MARVYLSPPHIAGREAELVAEAIESNWIAPLGPHVDAFEAEVAAVAGVEHAVALTSGTAALHLALVVLGIGAGDEVACSGFTFAASANAVTYSGASPFFVDATAESIRLNSVSGAIILAASGMILGIVGSVGASGVLRAVFPGSSSIDLGTYLVVVPLLVVVTSFAAWIPARRAAHIDPLVALRQE